MNPLILDGGLATELERRGHSLDDPLWSARLLVEAPGAIRDLHRDYLAAGADVIITASYQASFEGFARRGIGEAESARLLARSVELAKEARSEFLLEFDSAHRARPLVAASVGPYGAILHDGSEFRGEYGLSLDELVRFHRRRLEALVDAGADLLACETFPTLLEARAMVEVLKERPEARAWISFSCRDGKHTCRGEPIRQCAQELDRAEQVVAVGVNCTPPPFVESLVREIAAATTKPIVVYPNSGEVWDPEARSWTGDSDPQAFAELARRWWDAGASWIGGCCRTGPEHVRRLRARLGGDLKQSS